LAFTAYDLVLTNLKLSVIKKIFMFRLNKGNVYIRLLNYFAPISIADFLKIYEYLHKNKLAQV